MNPMVLYASAALASVGLAVFAVLVNLKVKTPWAKGPPANVAEAPAAPNEPTS